MSRPTQTDLTASSGAGGDGMSPSAIEEVLAELALVAEEVITQADAAQARLDELDDSREALIEQRRADDVPPWRPDPQHAIVSLRATVAVHVAREHRDAAREFAAWWADVATLAVLAAVTGRLVHPARVAAADPTIFLGEDELKHLPDVPEDARNLARLAANMAATPLGRDHKMAALAVDHAARAGLLISYTDDGQVVVKQDGSPEARRRRLWGDAWIEERVPALPAVNELSELLADHGAPAAIISAVAEAIRAVEDAVIALRRVQALEDRDTADEPTSAEDMENIDSLWNTAGQLTALLARYARTLMNTLPIVHAGGQPR